MVPSIGRRVLRTGIFVILLFVALFPMLWTVLGAFKNLRDIVTSTPKFLFTPTLSNFQTVLEEPSILAGLKNSAIIVGSAILISVVVGTPAAYAIARYTSRRKRNLQFFLLSIRFLPPVAVVIPYIAIWLQLGLYDSYLSVIVTYLVVALSAIMWLAVPVFEKLSPEYEEAARLDGCSAFKVFWRIALPISIPTLVGSYMFAFILLWNELLIGLSLTSKNLTLPVAASAFAMMGKELPWGVVNASAVLLLLPPLLFVGFFGNSIASFFLPGSAGE